MTILELKIPPVVVGAGVAALAWYVSGFQLLDWAGSRMAAAFWTGAGVAIAGAGVLSFARARTSVNPHRPSNTSVLVTAGIYQSSRNPMYLGMLFVLVGWAFWLGGLLPLLATTLFVPYMNRFQIVPEERAMMELFGDEYEKYSSRVRRWV